MRDQHVSLSNLSCITAAFRGRLGSSKTSFISGNSIDQRQTSSRCPAGPLESTSIPIPLVARHFALRESERTAEQDVPAEHAQPLGASARRGGEHGIVEPHRQPALASSAVSRAECDRPCIEKSMKRRLLRVGTPPRPGLCPAARPARHAPTPIPTADAARRRCVVGSGRGVGPWRVAGVIGWRRGVRRTRLRCTGAMRCRCRVRTGSGEGLEERGAFDVDARGALTFQAAHRSQSRFQAAVIGFDTTVGVLDCVMQRVRCQLIAFATAAARSVTTSDR